MKKTKQMAWLVVAFSILLIPFNVDAATVSTTQKKVAITADDFVYSVLRQTHWKAREVYYYKNSITKKEYLSELKKVYNGKLGSRQKAAIAADQVKTTKWVYPSSIVPQGVGYKSLSKVKNVYKNLFGKSTSVDLPSVRSVTQTNKYYLSSYAKKGNTVLSLSYDAEDDFSSRFVSAKKRGSTYIITKQYKYYSHWGIKYRGGKPTHTVSVKIKLKKKPSSPYKYNITGITFS